MQVAAPHPGMQDQTLLPGWTIQEVPSRQHEKRNCRMCSESTIPGLQVPYNHLKLHSKERAERKHLLDFHTASLPYCLGPGKLRSE